MRTVILAIDVSGIPATATAVYLLADHSGEKLPDGGDILQVDTYPLTIYSAAAVQELNARLKEQETEIQDLKHRLERLEARLGQGGAQ